MLKWFTKVAGLFAAAGIGINLTEILLSNRSFELTTRNWSPAISVTVIGIVVTAAALAISFFRPKSR